MFHFSGHLQGINCAIRLSSRALLSAHTIVFDGTRWSAAPDLMESEKHHFETLYTNRLFMATYILVSGTDEEWNDPLRACLI